MFECTLGAKTARSLYGWELPAGVHWDATADELPAAPDVSTDGSLVTDEMSGTACVESWVYAGGHVLMLGGIVGGGTLVALVQLLVVLMLLVGGFALCLGPLQTVQRAEFCEVTRALQASRAVRLGVDSLNVVRHVGRLLSVFWSLSMMVT